MFGSLMKASIAYREMVVEQRYFTNVSPAPRSNAFNYNVANLETSNFSCDLVSLIGAQPGARELKS